MSQEEEFRPVDEQVGYLLKKAASALRTAMDNALRPLDLTVPQFVCLERLRQQPGMSGSELARAMFVRRQTMNLVVKGLERRGLLIRSPVPRHGKALPTELAPAGMEKLAAAHQAVSVVERTLLDALTPDGERRLRADLTACATALTNLAGEAEPD